MTLALSTFAWRQADDVVHVATLADEFAGFVEGTPDGFRAHGAQGENLGLHTTLRRARDAVAVSGIASPSAGSLTQPHRPHRSPRRATSVASAARRKKRSPLAP